MISYFRCARRGPAAKAGGFDASSLSAATCWAPYSKVLSGMRNLAIAHMTKTLSDQLGAFGITVNLIHPGVVDTPHIRELYEREGIKQGKTPEQVEQRLHRHQRQLRRALAPIEMGWLIGFLASPKAGAEQIPGHHDAPHRMPDFAVFEIKTVARHAGKIMPSNSESRRKIAPDKNP